MKPYKEYKDSGVPWIGEIPKGWAIEKIKYNFAVVNGATPKSKENNYWNGNIIWVTPADYKTEDMFIYDSKKKITVEGLDSCGTTIVPANSIIVSNRAPIGSIGIAQKEMCTNQGCKSLVAKGDIEVKLIYYILSVMSEPLNMLGKGTTFLELSSYDLANFYLSLPPRDTQHRIADYLDRKTAAIDTLIVDKQKMIEFLQERRQAVISEAVTKGLDKNAKMTDSGIEWIGEIPEKWSIYPLFAIAHDNKVKNIENNCSNLLSLSYGKIVEKDIKTHFGLLPENFSNYQIVEKGYTVLRLTDLQNDKRSLRSGYVTEHGIITSAYTGLVPVSNMYGKFLSYLLHGYDINKIFYGLGNGVRQSLNYADLKHLPIPTPSLDTQHRIADYLDKKTDEIDNLITDIATQIEKLKEYRQAIISEAVTGKVKI